MKPLVIITGASSGIGAVMAQVFSAAGYPLGLIARQLAPMESLNLPQTLCYAADVTDIEALKTAIHAAENTLGAVDCLINNAGFAKGGDFTEISHLDHKKTIVSTSKALSTELKLFCRE